MTPEIRQEITQLRERNLSPKQIARKLGLKPAEVSAVIQTQAQAAADLRAEKGELPPLKYCLINTQAAEHLLDRAGHGKEEDEGGLAQIFLVRVEGSRLWMSSFLVDYWCLGIKQTFGPRRMDTRKCEHMIQDFSQRFNQKFREISLEQAQSIIFGAVDYAAKCGFKPHADFEQSKAHLGTPTEPLLKIEFGCNGKPLYVSGPYDNSAWILRTLQQHVGEGNFDFISEI